MGREKLLLFLLRDLGPMMSMSDFSQFIVCVAVEVEAMAAYDVTEGEEVEDEEQRTKHRTLRDALGQESEEGG